MMDGNLRFSQVRHAALDRAKGNGSVPTGHVTATCRPVGALTAAIIAAVLLLAGPTAAEPPLTGTARVLDGDTLEVAGQKVRLLGLDAPEGRQVCQRDGRPWRCREMVRRGMAVAYYPKRASAARATMMSRPTPKPSSAACGPPPSSCPPTGERLPADAHGDPYRSSDSYGGVSACSGQNNVKNKLEVHELKIMSRFPRMERLSQHG